MKKRGKLSKLPRVFFNGNADLFSILFYLKLKLWNQIEKKGGKCTGLTLKT